MTKIVGNYTLVRKVGSGLFGDIFIGYNNQNYQDSTIKVLKRELIKGDLLELFINEIKVMQNSINDSIIKLYAVQRTENNFYMMLQYCNEGDLMLYRKEKKYLSEEEAIEFLIWILNAFKILVKNKIIFKDFNLSNVLKHNGNIKITDFGLTKPLESNYQVKTKLGPSVNMAPEVLEDQEYNSKADIWSIGTVLYELLFGRPPFVADNIADLIKQIKTKQLEIPRKINNISKVTEDFLRKCLVVDPKQRIEWKDMFSHKITSFLEDNIKNDLEMTLNNESSLSLNMSRFYIKNNKFIQHPSEIEKKREINNYAYQVMKSGQINNAYQGTVIKRQVQIKEGQVSEQKKAQQSDNQSQKDEQRQIKENEIISKESVREAQIRIQKRNANRILHERNIYSFLATVAEQAMGNTVQKQSELVVFFLLKKLLQLLEYLVDNLDKRKNIFKLDQWENFIESQDFKLTFEFLEKEYDLFRLQFTNTLDQISSNPDTHDNLDPFLKSLISSDTTQNIEPALNTILLDYSHSLFQWIIQQIKDNKDIQALKPQMIQASRVLDCLKLDEIFQFDDPKLKKQFNFKLYYNEDDNMEIEELMEKIQTKLLATNEKMKQIDMKLLLRKQIS